MRRILHPLVFFFVALLCIPTYAQSFFGTGRANETPEVPPANTVLAPKDFGKLVNTLDQQTKASLRQDYNQQLSRQQPLIPSNLTSKRPPSNVNTSVISTPQSTTVTQTAQPPAPPATFEPPVVESTVPTPTYTQPPPQLPTLNNAPNQEVYTGFGGGNQNQSGTTSQPRNNSSGGWNIQY